MRYFVPNLKGGLGNQLFQLTYCMLLAKRLGGEVGIDPTLPFNAGQGDHPREHMGTFFRNIKIVPARRLPTWTEGRAARFSYRSYLIDGYFQNLVPEDMRDEVIRMFRFWEPKRRNVIGVHIRGGDYNKLREVYPDSTFSQKFDAVKRAQKYAEQATIEVHTDDVVYATSTFPSFPDAFLGDFQKLGECEAVVLSNSTWAWWSAFLGEVPTVIYPPSWINGPHPFNALGNKLYHHQVAVA